jgi:hypothetical protein
MANFTEKKLQFITDMIGLADRLLLSAEDCEAMDHAYSVNGFNPGGANAFGDADFNIQNKHLTAQSVADIMFAIGTVNNALTPGIKDSLRKALLGGLP